MMPGDSHAPEERPDVTSDTPSTLSVDQLTQALAQLMGEESTRQPPPAEESAGCAAPGPEAVDSTALTSTVHGAESLDDDVDDENITPESIIEALLFVGHPQDQPLTNRQMASYLRGVSPHEVDSLIEMLNAQYAEQKSAYRIVSVGAGYRMALHKDFEPLRNSFYGRIREARLSQAAVDLLAIVAYHQPIEREEIDRLRGQSSGATLAQLVRRQLLQVAHTPERPRKKIYRTSQRFLDLFGLESLEDLPSHEDF